MNNLIFRTKQLFGGPALNYTTDRGRSCCTTMQQESRKTRFVTAAFNFPYSPDVAPSDYYLLGNLKKDFESAIVGTMKR